MQSNLTRYIQDDSKASVVDFNEKGYLVSFATLGTYNKAVYDKLQEFSPSYLIVCESMDKLDIEIKNLRRLIASHREL